MKFHVNNKKTSITGWVAGDYSLETISVTLKRNDEVIKNTELNVMRPDVFKKGLHKTGLCGFSFNKEELNIIDGNIYSITVANGTLSTSKKIVSGDLSILAKEFDSFEIPRKDFSILDIPTSNLASGDEGSDLIVLKKLIIRMRRGIRGMGSVDGFNPKSYQFMDDDFSLFQSFITNNLNELKSVISTRYFLSIIDTIADCAKDVNMRLGALAISNLLFQERFAQTYKCIYDFQRKKSPIIDRQFEYWGGMKSNRLSKDDSYNVFISRNLECFKDHSLLLELFKYVIVKMAESDESILAFNMANSDFFNKGINHYINKFSYSK